ncbi:MAG: hypothetical protein WD995_14365 [Gemmatimonadota bacterium]
MLVMAALAWPAQAEGQSWREATLSRQLEGSGPVRARVSYGAGTFGLRATSEPLLYRMSLRYDEDAFEPVADYTGGRLELGLEGTSRSFRFGRGSSGGSMDLELARGVPMELDLNFGAVKADVDLGGLALTSLELSTGASESRIDVSEPNSSTLRRATFEIGAADFALRRLGNLGAERIDVKAGVGHVSLSLDGAWRTDARLSIEMGLGALELRVPEGLGIMVRKDSFLTSFDPEGLVKRGDAYYSLDWEDADRKVTIDLNAAFGSVQVIWIR